MSSPSDPTDLNIDEIPADVVGRLRTCRGLERVRIIVNPRVLASPLSYLDHRCMDFDFLGNRESGACQHQAGEESERRERGQHGAANWFISHHFAASGLSTSRPCVESSGSKRTGSVSARVSPYLPRYIVGWASQETGMCGESIKCVVFREQ